MELVVGTTSAIKISALSQSFPEYKVSGVDVPSAVPPQPVGRLETALGARFRAMRARAGRSDAAMWAGIENGMYTVSGEEGCKWVDAACIVLLRGADNLEIAEFWSDTLDIPPDFPKGPNGEWSLLKDPHNEITKGARPRSKFIQDALDAFVRQPTFAPVRIPKEQSTAGSCYCGAVRYRVSGPFLELKHCHCALCRKLHAATVVSFASCLKGDFVLEGSCRMIQAPQGAERKSCTSLSLDLTRLAVSVRNVAHMFSPRPSGTPESSMWHLQLLMTAVQP